MREPVVVNGITRWMNPTDQTESVETDHTEAEAPARAADQTERRQPAEAAEQVVPILREEIGEVLRSIRQRQGRTLREVSHEARVSLGYLSEVERGQKEASSELLAAISAALEVPMSVMLREVSDRIAVTEGVSIPDTVPENFETPHRVSSASMAETAASRRLSQQQQRAAQAAVAASSRRVGLTPEQYQRALRQRRHTAGTQARTGGYQYQGSH